MCIEPRLRRALVASYGPEVGRDSCAAALLWALEHPRKALRIQNLAGYLFRVAQTHAARELHIRNREQAFDPTLYSGCSIELTPSLDLAALSERQRAAVMLTVAWRYTLQEAAEVLGCSVASVRTHQARALSKLAANLREESNA